MSSKKELSEREMWELISLQMYNKLIHSLLRIQQRVRETEDAVAFHALLERASRETNQDVVDGFEYFATLYATELVIGERLALPFEYLQEAARSILEDTKPQLGVHRDVDPNLPLQ